MSEKLRMLKLKCFYCEMENSTETAQLKNWEFFLFYCFKDTKFFFHIYIEQSGGNELYCRAEMYTVFHSICTENFRIPAGATFFMYL